MTSKLIEELRAGIRRDLYSLSGGDVMYLIDHAAPQDISKANRVSESVECSPGRKADMREGDGRGGSCSNLPEHVKASAPDSDMPAVAAPFLNWLWEKTPQTMQVLWETFLEEKQE